MYFMPSLSATCETALYLLGWVAGVASITEAGAVHGPARGRALVFAPTVIAA